MGDMCGNIVVIFVALWLLVPLDHKKLSTLGQSMRDVFLLFCSALGGHQSPARHWLGAAPTLAPSPRPGVSRALSCHSTRQHESERWPGLGGVPSGQEHSAI